MQKGVCGNAWFPHGCLDVSYMSWDKSENPCLCGNHTFLNLVHHYHLESTWHMASTLGPWLTHLIGKCVISIWAWVLANSHIPTIAQSSFSSQSFIKWTCLQPDSMNFSRGGFFDHCIDFCSQFKNIYHVYFLVHYYVALWKQCFSILWYLWAISLFSER